MYEVPEMDLIPTDDSKVKLLNRINNSYGEWFTIVKSELFTKELHNSNTLLCFNLIYVTDSDIITIEESKSKLALIEHSIDEAFCEFLKSNNYLNYRRIL
jgi:hypothetical protein